MDASNDLVTLVIHHQVKSEGKPLYEVWLKEIAEAAQRFPGHLGVNIIRPHGASNSYTIILRFASHEQLKGWIDSNIRKTLIGRAAPLFLQEEEIEIETGLEFWFTPRAPKQLHARPFKQFLLTFSAIFPLTLIVPWALHPLFQLVPVLGRPLISNFIVAAILVWLMVYVIMPRYTRLVARWLFD